MAEQETLLAELDEIRDSYVRDVRQFIELMKERRLPLVESLKEYSLWLDQEHHGKLYSPATINRKIAAAKSRIRYAFKRGSSASDLGAKFRLEEALKEVKLRRIDIAVISPEKVLSIEESKRLAKETRDRTISLMVRFLVGTGVRISEMLAIRLSDLRPTDEEFVEVRVVGKGGKERLIHVKAGFIAQVRDHFRGAAYLFEHDERPFSRISVTNRIKHESLRTIGREVSAHQLRHTWAMIQIRRGKDVRAVAAALGRSDRGSAAKARTQELLEPREAFLDVQEADRRE